MLSVQGMSVCRVAIFSCLKLCPGALCLVGIDCSSWGLPARGTTWRTVINNAVGLVGRSMVDNGSKMASRFHETIIHSLSFHGKLIKAIVCLQLRSMHDRWYTNAIAEGGTMPSLCTCCSWLLRGRTTPAKHIVPMVSMAVAPRNCVLCFLS